MSDKQGQIYELFRFVLAVAIFVVAVLVLFLVYDIGRSHQDIENKQNIIMERLQIEEELNAELE